MKRFSIVLALLLLAGAPAGQRSALLLNPDAPEFRAPDPELSTVRLDTTKVIVDIEATRAWAPRGADRFISLVRAGYYDDTRIFRINPGRWAQFGIHGDPAIAKAWCPRMFPDDPFKTSNTRGTVAFAFAVPKGRTTRPSRPSAASSPAWTSSMR
jgi:hypothetical protein